MSRSTEEVELSFTLYHETEKAILVSEDDGKTKTWLPLSQIEFERSMDAKGHDTVTVTMPLWLAEKSKFAGY